MEQTSTASAPSAAAATAAASLAAVAQQLAGGSPLGAQELLGAEAACLQLFDVLSAQAASTADPRVALAHAHFAEAFSRHAQRGSIAAASTVETTSAHALHLDEFDQLRAGTTDFSAEPRFAPGRTVYLDAATALASLLDLNCFEAARRVNDAHLVYARKDISGTACPPRFTLLAEHFAGTPDPDADHPASAAASPSGWALPQLHQQPDPREVLKTARDLDKFEPEDTTFDGLPTSATATDADGTLLEDRASAHLSEYGVGTRQKRLGQLIKAYKDAHQETKTPPLGLFRGKVVNGVHEYTARVDDPDSELWESMIAQADNKRTQAGAAARQAGSGAADASEPAEQTADGLWHSNDPAPDWARDTGSGEDSTAAEQAGASKPQPKPQPNPGVPGLPDPCTVAERRLNALNAVLRNTDPDGKGKRIVPEIVVHARYEDLNDLGSLTGITAHGVKLSAPQLRMMLCEAKVLSPIYNADGAILDLGRDSRLFPRWMKLAARDRDGGCLVPGCTADPALLEFHHFKPWAKGGRTRLEDCCPLCTAHHTMVHAGYLKMAKLKGLPWVILPRHLDPEQVPRRNTCFART